MKAFFKSVSSKLKQKSQGNKIQILSDLHLEVGNQYSTYTFSVTAPLLLLAGDIGRLVDYEEYLAFLLRQVSRYERVFLVLGNHEFYGLSYEAGVERAEQLVREASAAAAAEKEGDEDKVVLLHRTRWDDEQSPLTILGCTLWSHIPEASYETVQSKVNDFIKIESWNTERHSHIHAQELAWLRDQIATLVAQSNEHNFRRRVVVATHHAPCIEGTSSPEHVGSPLNCAFATDLLSPPNDGQLSWDDVVVWVFGHTHYSADFVRDGMRVVSNQRGYVVPGSLEHKEEEGKKGKKGVHEFDTARTISWMDE